MQPECDVGIACDPRRVRHIEAHSFKEDDEAAADDDRAEDVHVKVRPKRQPEGDDRCRLFPCKVRKSKPAFIV